jgi:hypothetical protein
MTYSLDTCLSFFEGVPEKFRPLNLRSSLRETDSLIFGKVQGKLTVAEKKWLINEAHEKNEEWPPCLHKYRNCTKKGLEARFGLYNKFFRHNPFDKPIVACGGRREKLDKQSLVDIAAALNGLHSAGREMGLVTTKRLLRNEIEKSAMRSGKAIDLNTIPIRGVTRRYCDKFLERHDMHERIGDMNTVNRNTRMSCPRGCFASYLLYFAYHANGHAWNIWT